MNSKTQAYNNRQSGSALVTILAVAAILAVLGAIVFMLVNKKDNEFSLANISHQSRTATTSEDVKALLTDVHAGKHDAKCTYLLKSIKSTLYIQGAKRMRVDTIIGDKPGHFVRMNDKMYMWADGNPKGTILPISDETIDNAYTPDGFASKVDEYKIKCESVGRLSESLFTPPSNVTFAEFKDQIRSSSSSE